jgi:hypothetical protein
MNAIIYIYIYIYIYYFSSPGHVEEKQMELRWHSMLFHLTTERTYDNDCYMYRETLWFPTSVPKLKSTSSRFDRSGTKMTTGEAFFTSILLSCVFVRQGKEATYNCRGIAVTLCIGKSRDSVGRISTKEASAGPLYKKLDPSWSSWYEPRYLAECY